MEKQVGQDMEDQGSITGHSTSVKPFKGDDRHRFHSWMLAVSMSNDGNGFASIEIMNFRFPRASGAKLQSTLFIIVSAPAVSVLASWASLECLR